MNKDKLPTFTFVIPCYNSEVDIHKCLNSILEVDYPKDRYKVIVVDDASIDQTVKIIKEIDSQKIKLISLKKNQGPANARNIGMQKAETDYVVFIDTDTIVDKKILLNFAASIRKFPKSLFSGEISYFGKRNLLAKMIEKANIFPMRSGSSSDLLWASTNNLCLPRKIYKNFSFNADFPLAAGEDVEFSFRVRSQGNRIIFNDQAVVYHKSHSSFKEAVKRAFRYGRGTSYLINLFPKKGFISLALIAKFLVGLSFLAFFFLFLLSKNIRFILVPLVYLLISSYYFFSSYYLREKIYQEGLLFTLTLSIFRNFMVFIYQLGIMHNNSKIGNHLFYDLLPKHMNKRASKGLALSSFINDLFSYLFAYLLFF